jgi:hypothetical protein
MLTGSAGHGAAAPRGAATPHPDARRRAAIAQREPRMVRRLTQQRLSCKQKEKQNKIEKEYAELSVRYKTRDCAAGFCARLRARSSIVIMKKFPEFPRGTLLENRSRFVNV